VVKSDISKQNVKFDYMRLKHIGSYVSQRLKPCNVKTVSDMYADPTTPSQYDLRYYFIHLSELS